MVTYIAGLKDLSEGAEKLLRYFLNLELARTPKPTRIAKDLKCSRQSVYNYYNELVEKGVFKSDDKPQEPTKKD